MSELRIIFMGTPDFAVASLDILVQSNFNIVGVITAPDKPAGRGRKIQQSAVKKYAESKGLHILQPKNLKDPGFIEELSALNANLQVVVAFRMLPKAVWKMPEFGTFNLHASLLPDYRGAAPINWAIINGEEKTGVTTFFIDEKIDTGLIILQESIDIAANETVGALHDQLMQIGSELVLKTVKLIETGEVPTIAQHDESTKTAPKIFPETCRIDWNQSVDIIYNLIRGLNPYPAAWTVLKHRDAELKVKLFDVEKESTPHNQKPGKIRVENKEIIVVVPDGYLKVNSLQIAGKKRMDSKDLLNGFDFGENSLFI